MPDSFVQLPADGTGKRLKTFVDAAGDHLQYIYARDENPLVLYRGRASTLITPGRAGTTGQPLSTFWNGSTGRVCRVTAVGVDLYCTVVKAITVPPPVVRFYRVAVAPLNGSTITKVAEDSALSSDANIILRGDASADRTSATLALAATNSGGAITQEYAARFITAAGYEMYDKTIFFDQSELVLRPSEGVVLRLDYAAATSNPVTDMWIAHWIWTEE